jgi:hypothetical protein
MRGIKLQQQRYSMRYIGCARRDSSEILIDSASSSTSSSDASMSSQTYTQPMHTLTTAGRCENHKIYTKQKQSRQTEFTTMDVVPQMREPVKDPADRPAAQRSNGKSVRFTGNGQQKFTEPCSHDYS